MSDNDLRPPPRWLDETGAEGAQKRELLQHGTALREWPQGRRDAVWQEVERKWASPRRIDWRLPALAGAAAVLAVAMAVGLSPRARHLPVGDLGQVTLSADAQVGATPTAEHPELTLEAGALEAEINHRPAGQPFIVVTPHVRIVVVGTHFSVRVDPRATEVSVQEGKVRVEGPDGQAFVSAGESLRSDDPKLHPSRPAPTPAAAPRASDRLDKNIANVPECAALGAAEARASCVAGVAGGSGLEAENALVSQALDRRDRGDLQGAIASLREYRSRFPDGLFGPEIGFELVHELLDAKDYAHAVQEAQRVEKQFPSDRRASQLALLRAQVLREHLEDPTGATAIAEKLAAAGPVQEAAQAELALDLEAAGRGEAAKAAWRIYLERFPDGPHADTAREHLHP